jgi:hypothetical protein
MRSRSHFRALLIAFLSVLLAGAGVPLQELRLYADAFQDTRAAGHILLDKIQPIIAATPVQVPAADQAQSPQSNDCSIDRHGAPSCFAPYLPLPEDRAADPPSIVMRRVALDLIAAYNSILIDIASGRDPREIRPRFEEVAQFAGTILTLTGAGSGMVALLPPVSAGLQRLSERYRGARNAALTRQEILDNREVVKALLGQLQQDVPKLYEIYRLKRLDDRREALSANNEPQAQAVSQDLRRFHASLAAYFILLAKTADALDLLAAAAADKPAAASAPNPADLLRNAMMLRRDASHFWDTVRKVGDGNR